MVYRQRIVLCSQYCAFAVGELFNMGFNRQAILLSSFKHFFGLCGGKSNGLAKHIHSISKVIVGNIG